MVNLFKTFIITQNVASVLQVLHTTYSIIWILHIASVKILHIVSIKLDVILYIVELLFQKKSVEY